MNLQGLSRFNDTTYRYFDNTLDRISYNSPKPKKKRLEVSVLDECQAGMWKNQIR